MAALFAATTISGQNADFESISLPTELFLEWIRFNWDIKWNWLI